MKDPGSRIQQLRVLVLHKEKSINYKEKLEMGYTLQNGDLTGNYHVKLTFSPKP